MTTLKALFFVFGGIGVVVGIWCHLRELAGVSSKLGKNSWSQEDVSRSQRVLAIKFF